MIPFEEEDIEDKRQRLDELFCRSRVIEYCKFDVRELDDEIFNALQDYREDVQLLFTLIPKELLPNWAESYYQKNK